MTEFVRRRHSKKPKPEPKPQLSLERRIGNQHIARHMLARFGWRRWMEPYLERDGTPIEQK